MSNRYIKTIVSEGGANGATAYLDISDVRAIFEKHIRIGESKERTWVSYIDDTNGVQYQIMGIRAADLAEEIQRRVHCEMDYARLGKASLVPETPEKPEKKETE